MSKNLGTTAAWRISIWTTLAFALGTAVAFSIVYFLVAQGIRERSDTWLSGEAEVLARVSADTPKDHLYHRVVAEVAELATQEVPDERNAKGERLNSVFFLATDPNSSEPPLWVGPSPKDAFVKAVQQAKLVRGTPRSIRVEGWDETFPSRFPGTRWKNCLCRTLGSWRQPSAARAGRSLPYGVGRHVSPRLRDLVLERPPYAASGRTHYRNCRANRHQGPR